MQFDAADAQRLHDRAERSSNEARKTILGLSSGALGVLFVALTGKVEPGLDLSSRVIVIAGVLLFGTSVLLGIVIWKLDAQSSYFQARGIDAKDSSKKTLYLSKCLKLNRIKRRVNMTQPILFIMGVIAIMIYTVLRASA